MSIRDSRHLSEIALFTGGVIYGMSTPVGREMGVWMQPLAITAVRFLLALPFCLLGLRLSRRVVQASLIHLMPVGLLYGACATLFTFSFFNTSIAVAVFGYYLANLLSSLALGIWLHHEPFDRATAIAFCSSVLAVILVALGQGGGDLGNWNGLILAVLSGLCATGISQEQKRVAKNFDGEVITLAQVVGGAVFCWTAVLIVGDTSFTNLSSGGFALAVVYGLMFWACHRLMAFGFRDGPIGIGTVLLSVEVIVGPALALVFFDETLTSLELLGGLFTIVAIVAAAKRSPTDEAERETVKAN